MRRLVAWLVDCLCILVWAGIVAIVGVPLYLSGVVLITSDLVANAMSAVLLIVPVVLGAAWCESRGGAATPGKRLNKLTVRTGRHIPSFRAAALRNAIKIGLPWVIGHAAVFALVGSSSDESAPVGVWALLIGAYVLPLVWVASIFIGDGRAPYDRLSHTVVSHALPTTRLRG